MSDQQPLSVTPTYDSEGHISATLCYASGHCVTQPYHVVQRGLVQKCPFCGAPLHVSAAQQRVYCMNNECAPRIQTILLQQLDRLGLNPAWLHPLMADGWIGHILPPGTRNLVMVAHRHPDAAVQEALLARLKALSFTDFLMLLHVPKAFLTLIEDDLDACTSLKELHETLIYGSAETLQHPEAFHVGKLAMYINSHYALSLLEHNRTSHPVWTEGS